jgi:hypothetical protein
VAGDDSSHEFSSALVGMEKFLSVLLDSPPSRVFVLDSRPTLKHISAYSDATGHGFIGLAAVDNHSGCRYVSGGQCPEWLVAELPHVNQLEALASLCLDLTFADLFEGRQVWHFLDNTTAMSVQVHGYANKPEMAQLAEMCAIMRVSLSMDKYFEYVDTNANVADAPSRPNSEKVKQVAKDLVAKMHQVPIVFPSKEQWNDIRLLFRSTSVSRNDEQPCKKQRCAV